MKKFNIHSEESKHVAVYSVNDVAQADINEAVYAAFCVAGQTVLAHSTCFISGDRSASELAGDFGWRTPALLVTDENVWSEVCIKAGDYQCSFLTENVFANMAEWEGVCGITAKQAYRFHCEAEEGWVNPDAQLKPYKRDRVYNPKRVSVASEERRINEKFAVLGLLTQSLTSEGMKKALSLLTAVKSAEKLYDYATAEMARKVMCRWHWDVYGTQNNMHTIPFDAKDFQYAPEYWKQVDEAYVKELLARWKQFTAANPAPDWIKKDDMVQLKNQAIAPKKWQGKLKVCRVFGMIDTYCRDIDWHAEVSTTKGKWDSMDRSVKWFEKWEESPSEPKPGTKEKIEKKEKKAVKPQPTFAEMLRKVLLAA